MSRGRGRMVKLNGEVYRQLPTGILVAASPRELRRGSRDGKAIVRNQETGRILPCCYGPCEKDGSDRIHIDVPHNAPRWPGEKLRYIFCSEVCRREFAKGTPYERYL